MSTDTMIAITQSRLGGPEVLEAVEREIPRPRTNEVLVRVHAASVNPTDWKHRATGGFIGEPPFTLGWDLSGVIIETGVGVARFEVGDEVFGMVSYPFGHGTHAEYVAVPARVLVKKPDEISHVEAAALPLVSLTAWQALTKYAGLTAGQRVLIHAGAGGVGHVAVQIAKWAGAHVIATASAKNHAFLTEIGADECIDYHAQPFEDVARDIDVVLDTVGHDYSNRSLRVLREGGVVVSTLPIGSKSFAADAERLGRKATRMLVDSSESDMLMIAELVRQGALRAHIAGTFPLVEATRAHELGETNRTVGKLVLVAE
ncbi:NADPH:quinone reductase [Microbacterium sorbitolivorans]|uniref:NADP-dependent oxidoreductase n=1 Tax=Microbacterium sorbitolivorans TaxID=1867410 RepID=A0A367Y4Y9_9MICO|nr:NADP-dependent oxidoreductase [Microbacterium sorbitolivorans]RCK60122.1 NADP-dependent oxidoreductase [Microbacterium sorbitolivorans]GGF42980.1 NADPH:quinone reductase [Microbacterium sorbitolivorans]